MRYLLLLILLSGCAGIPERLDLAEAKGAAIADEILKRSLFGVCLAPTMGAWMREFGHDPERAKAWKVLCTANPEAVDALILP